MRIGDAILRTYARIVAPPDTEFDNPSGSSWITGGNNVNPITTGEVTASTGWRLVLLCAATRGSAGTPAANRTLSSIAGTGDFSALDLSDFTEHEFETFRDDADGRGGVVYGLSHVLSSGGTGAMEVTWSGGPFGSAAILIALPACSLIDSAQNAVNNAATTLPLTLAGTPNADDLILSLVCQPNQATTPSVPTDWTSLGSLNATNTAHHAAYRNGDAADVNTWGSISGSHPAGGVILQFRKTV